MQMPTATQAAMKEANGQGSFEISGKIIRFVIDGKLWAKWNCKTSADAKTQLRMFRASPKHF